MTTRPPRLGSPSHMRRDHSRLTCLIVAALAIGCTHAATETYRLPPAPDPGAQGQVGQALPRAPYDVDEHTVVMLHFDEPGGPVAKDAGPHGHHGKLQGPPQHPEWNVDCRFGGCLRFDGHNEDVNRDGRGDADGLVLSTGGDLDARATGLTVEFWVRHDHLSTPQFYLARAGGAGRYMIGTRGRALYVYLHPADGDRTYFVSRPCLEPKRWHAVAMTYDGQMVRLFADGREVGRKVCVGKLGGSALLTMVGRDIDQRADQIRGFAGQLDELRISNIARRRFSRVAGPPQKSAPTPTPAPKPKAPPAPKHPVTVTGVVFRDGNQNGRRDAGEPPMPGVLVSDGDAVVAAGAEGAFRFPLTVAGLARGARHVFVTVPEGFRATGPWYYTVDVAAGSEQRVELGLVESPATAGPDLTFVAGGDTQYDLADQYEHLVADLKEIETLDLPGRPVAFGVFPGDLTQYGHLKHLEAFAKGIRDIWTRPGRVVFGGHDGNNPTRLGNFTRVFGPTAYSWDAGGRHFIGLISELHYLTPAQLQRQVRWLRADMAHQPPDRPIWVVTHTPEAIDEHLAQIAETHRIEGVVRGHVHITTVYGGPGGVPVIDTSPMRTLEWGVFTRKIRVITADGDGVRSQTRVLGQQQRLVVIAPIPGAPVSAGPLTLQVNAYDTSHPVERVEATLTDPSGVASAHSLRSHGAWSWHGEISPTEPGQSRLDVTAHARGGLQWSRTVHFDVRPKGKRARPRPARDWPSLLGFKHRARVAPQAIEPPLELAWIGHTDGRMPMFSSPIVVDGKVLIGVADGEIGWRRAGVVCFDARTGRRLWKTATESDIVHTIAAHRGRVFALTSNGVMTALSIATGKRRWARPLYDAPRYEFTLGLSPVMVADNTVFGAVDFGPTVALDAKTGSVRWQRPVGYGWHRTSGLSVYDGVGFLNDEVSVVAVDPSSGDLRWTQKIGHARGYSTPVRSGDGLYVAHLGTVRRLDPHSGRIVWSARMAPSKCPSLPVEHGGRVFVGAGRSLAALDANDGRMLWQIRTDDPEHFADNRWQTLQESSSVAVAGAHVYVGSENGSFYALDAATGDRVWTHFIGVPIKSAPAVSGNMIYVAAYDGSVYAYVQAPRAGTVKSR